MNTKRTIRQGIKVNNPSCSHHSNQEEKDVETDKIESASILNKSSPISFPHKIIIEKKDRRRGKQSFESSNKIENANYESNEVRQLNENRYSTRNKIREKRHRIFDNLLRRKIENAQKHECKGHLRNKHEYNPSINIQSRFSKQKEDSARSKLNSRNIGYGEIVKIIQKKKTRIQSAHPVMKELTLQNRFNNNINDSYIVNHKLKESRPMSTVKSNMKEYLNKIIIMANKRHSFKIIFLHINF